MIFCLDQYYFMAQGSQSMNVISHFLSIENYADTGQTKLKMEILHLKTVISYSSGRWLLPHNKCRRVCKLCKLWAAWIRAPNNMSQTIHFTLGAELISWPGQGTL